MAVLALMPPADVPFLGGLHASTAPRAATGCPGPRQVSGPLSLTSGGLARSAWIHVPPAGRGGGRLPLVLALHGVGGNGRFMESYSGLSGMADRRGFVVAYPDALGATPRWNIAGAAGQAPDDLAFARDLIDRLASAWCVDPGRIYATGISNGGGMVARLGCDLSDRLRAIAPVAGGYSTLPECRPRRRVSVLEIHGTGDPVVPYAGRGPARAGNVRGYLRGWLRRDGCPTRLSRSVPVRRVVRLDWGACADGTSVAHLKILGGGHEWPEVAPEKGDRSPGLSAAREVWRFFAARR